MKTIKIPLYLIVLYVLFVPQVHSQTSVATITDLVGKVMVLKSGESEWIRAQLYLPLEKMDRIKTFIGSQSEITMEDGSIFKIEENTEFEISQIEYTQNKKRNYLLNLIRGILLSSIEKHSYESTVSVRTPTAVLAVRGTEFAIEVPDEQTTEVAVYTGQIAVAHMEDTGTLSREEVMLSPDQQTTIKFRQRPLVPFALRQRMMERRSKVLKFKLRQETLRKNWKNITQRRMIVQKEIYTRLKSVKQKPVYRKPKLQRKPIIRK